MKRTSAYLFTVYDLSDEKIYGVRKAIAKTNAEIRRNSVSNEQFRVSIMPRLGQCNPAAVLYRRPSGPKANSHTVRQRYGDRYDVYVHRRS